GFGAAGQRLVDGFPQPLRLVDPLHENLTRVEIVVAGLAGYQREDWRIGFDETSGKSMRQDTDAIGDVALPHQRRVYGRPLLAVLAQIDALGKDVVHQFAKAIDGVVLAQ